jgi:hypothetical protein
MKHLRRVPPTIRATSLLALGALGVHQLRYVLAYGPAASDELAHQGHGYLAQLAPVLAGLAVATVMATLIAAAFHRGTPAERREVPIPVGTALFAGALLVTFSTQELAEGLLAPAHPSGFAALLAHGGWIACPLALVIGALATIAVRGLQGAERLLTGALVRREPRRFGARPEVATPLVCCERRPLAALTLGFGFARRPPPSPLLNG